MIERARHGFTLFEVMAAVLVLGLIYTVLASTAIQGLRAEGTSRRRLEASLLADQVLHDLEGQLLTGSFPETGSHEEEMGDYRVTVEVLPFDPSPFLAQDAQEAPDRAEASFSLLDPQPTGEPSLLRTFEVAVSWTEGFDEHRVTRTTFAYDVAVVASLIGSGDGSEGAGAAEGSDATGQGGQSDSGGSTSGRSGGSSQSDMDAQIQRMLEQLRNAK